MSLSGVADGQTLVVQVQGLKDLAGNVSSVIHTARAGVLLGDVNGSGTVNITDINITKSRSGQMVNGVTFRSDVNASGTINITDINLVKSRSGRTLAPPPPAVMAGMAASLWSPARIGTTRDEEPDGASVLVSSVA